MAGKTQVEILIETLAEMRREERRRQEVQLRGHVKAYVERFMNGFRTESTRSRSNLDWPPQSKLTARRAVREMRDD